MTPLDSDSENKGLWWREKTRLIRSSARTFVNALPLFILWLMIPFVLLILSSLYQSSRLLFERNDRTRLEKEYKFSGLNSEPLTLHISSPKKLRIEMDEPYDDSIAIWLTGPVSNAPQGQTLAAYTFSLAFENESADFMDEKGNPIPGIVTLSPAQNNNASEILYLKSNPESLDKGEKIVVVIGESPSFRKLDSISILIESSFQSQLRHFLDAVLSLPTLIGGLLTAIAGFGLQQWKVLNDEEQHYRVGQEETTYSRLQESLKDERYQRAFEIYQNYAKEVETTSPRIKGLFDDHILPQKLRKEIKEKLDQMDFQKAIDLYLEYSKGNVMGIESIWDDEVSRKFSELLINNFRAMQEMYQILDRDSLLTSKIKKLWSIREEYYFDDKGISVSLLRQLLKPWPELIIYGVNHKRQERAGEKKGMDIVGMNMNPFGSEKVEEDFLFPGAPDFIFKRRILNEAENERLPSVFEEMNDTFCLAIEQSVSESQFFIGAPGSGKTAYALLLAGRSFFFNQKTIPIYCKISIRDSVETLLRHIIESLLNYYVTNPNEFLKQDVERKSGVAALFSNYLANGSELMFRLNLSGLSSDTMSEEFQRQLMKLVKSARFIKLTYSDSAHLLLQSFPKEYKGIMFLFDYQDAPVKLPERNKNIIQFMLQLQKGGGVLKVFSTPSAFSIAVIEQLMLPVVEIKWSFDKLKDVLRTRLENSNAKGVSFLFDPSLRQVAQDLVLKSVDTPGDLIRKGNEILSYIGQNNKKIGIDGANHIFGKSLVNKILKGS